MSDTFGTEPSNLEPSTETGPEAPAESSLPETGGDNPAWAPWRDKLGDAIFEGVKPLLSEQDKQTSRKFEEIHQQYAPLKEYEQFGKPDELRTMKQVVDMLNNDPVAFYQAMQGAPAIQAFLEQNKPQEQPEVGQDPELSDLDNDPRFKQLQEQNQQFMQYLENQQAQEAAAKADQELEQELTGFFGTRPEFTREDQADIINRMAASYQTGNPLSLEQAAQQFTARRDQILSTPRPGASAPTVMPTNGGAPGANSKLNLGKMSSTETQNMLAALLDANKTQG